MSNEVASDAIESRRAGQETEEVLRNSTISTSVASEQPAPAPLTPR